MYCRRLLILFVTTLLSTSINPMAAANEITLKAGNSFGLRISGVPAEEVAMVSQKFTISDEGTIRLPYLKTGIRAAGLTPSALARKIEAAYRSAQIYTQPVIQVDATPGQEQRFVTVIGEVRNASTIAYVPGLRLLDAIARAGGFTDFAKESKVKLTRGSKVSYHDLRRSSDKENVPLQPNDLITVR